MKRYILLALIVAIPILAIAKDPDYRGAPVMNFDGKYGPVAKYTFTDNLAVTLQTAYTGGTPAGTWKSGNYNPDGWLVCVETQAARFDPGGGSPVGGTNGFPLAVGDCAKFFGSGIADRTKFCPKDNSAYPVLQIAPIYPR